MKLNVTLRALIVTLSSACAVPASAADSAVVLMYHRFGEDRYPSTSIRIEQFEAQLEHLQVNGYAVVPLADVAAAINDDAPLPDRAVAITIDDAYRSVYVAHLISNSFKEKVDKPVSFTDDSNYV